MVNWNILKELRTKEEVLNYFKQLGKNITEEELETLKLSYNKAQESDDVLTMQQLDDVAGGNLIFILNRRENLLAFSLTGQFQLYESRLNGERGDEWCSRTLTACNEPGDPLIGRGHIFRFPRGQINQVLGSELRQPLVGRFIGEDPNHPGNLIQLANFTENMTDREFDVEKGHVDPYAINDLTASPNNIMIIWTDAFSRNLRRGGNFEFSHYSDISVFPISQVGRHHVPLSVRRMLPQIRTYIEHRINTGQGVSWQERVILDEITEAGILGTQNAR